MDTTCIGVVGAGQMGQGIAQVSAQSGYKTLLWDINSSSLVTALQNISKRLLRSVEKGKITQEEAKATEGNIIKVSSLDELKECHFVIEAIIEKLEAKVETFKKLEGIVSDECILATNTSSISITKIAGQLQRPSRVIGMHFMNPVPVMKLVEIIRALQTSEETFEKTRSLAHSLGKTCVIANDSAGFIVNRILCPMINEAIYLLQEGVDKESIDQAMKLGTNHPMGPLELADFIGLDTCLYILRILHAELGEDKYRPCPLLVKYVDAGWLGRKTGRGFYVYDK